MVAVIRNSPCWTRALELAVSGLLALLLLLLLLAPHADVASATAASSAAVSGRFI
jgi:hypothetical protein